MSTHIYLGTKHCGCHVAGHVDDGSQDLKKWIGDWITRGLTVSRVALADVRGGSVEIGCKHVEKQAELFE